MKNSNETPFNISVPGMCSIGLLCVIFDAVSEKLGTYPHYGFSRFGNMELLGIFIPLLIFIIPIFAKKYRGKLWDRKSIVICIIVLIISVVLITITYTNKEYYWDLWFESGHWTRDDCPPIRWDIWNIIQPSIDRFKSINQL